MSHLLAMAMAVLGWSPVAITILMPASRTLAMASGTLALGGSIIDISPSSR